MAQFKRAEPRKKAAPAQTIQCSKKRVYAGRIFVEIECSTHGVADQIMDDVLSAYGIQKEE